MKNLVYVITMAFILVACGGGKGTEIPTPKPNTAPTTPNLLTPVNNSLCINNEQTFSWEASQDAERDAITYEIQLASNNTFTNNKVVYFTTSISKNITLKKGEAYYWRVRAKDSDKTGNYSKIFQFYTEGEEQSNYLPFLPQLKSPALNAVIPTSEITLQWNASDADADALKYDIYFEETNPPTKNIAANISENQYKTTVKSLKTYYWYVVVKDSKGGQTKGQVWYFKTD